MSNQQLEALRLMATATHKAAAAIASQLASVATTATQVGTAAEAAPMPAAAGGAGPVCAANGLVITGAVAAAQGTTAGGLGSVVAPMDVDQPRTEAAAAGSCVLSAGAGLAVSLQEGSITHPQEAAMQAGESRQQQQQQAHQQQGSLLLQSPEGAAAAAAAEPYEVMELRCRLILLQQLLVQALGGQHAGAKGRGGQLVLAAGGGGQAGRSSSSSSSWGCPPEQLCQALKGFSSCRSIGSWRQGRQDKFTAGGAAEPTGVAGAGGSQSRRSSSGDVQQPGVPSWVHRLLGRDPELLALLHGVQRQLLELVRKCINSPGARPVGVPPPSPAVPAAAAAGGDRIAGGTAAAAGAGERPGTAAAGPGTRGLQAGARRGLNLSTQTGKVVLLEAAIAVAVAHELDPAAAENHAGAVELVEGLVSALGCQYNSAGEVMRFLQMAHGRLLRMLGMVWGEGESCGAVESANDRSTAAAPMAARCEVGAVDRNQHITDRQQRQLPFQELPARPSAAGAAAAAVEQQAQQPRQQLVLQNRSGGLCHFSGQTAGTAISSHASQSGTASAQYVGAACDRAVAQLLYLMYGVDLKWRRASYYSSKDGKWVLGETSWVQQDVEEGEEGSGAEDQGEEVAVLQPKVVNLQAPEHQPLLLQLWQYLYEFMPHRRGLLYQLELHLQRQEQQQQGQQQQQPEHQRQQQAPGVRDDDDKLQHKSLAVFEGEYWKSCSGLLSVLVEVLPPPPAEVVAAGMQQIMGLLDDGAVMDDAALAMGSEVMMNQLDR